jgi:hypothetical protein
MAGVAMVQAAMGTLAHMTAHGDQPHMMVHQAARTRQQPSTMNHGNPAITTVSTTTRPSLAIRPPASL